jgi:electron transport complex protein RnfG
MFEKVKNKILTTTGILTMFAIVSAILVGITFLQTQDAIEYNEKLTLLKQLNTIVPTGSYDNDLLSDTVTIKADRQLGTTDDTLAYRARKDGKDVAVVFSSIAPDGYNGPIHILVGVKQDARIAGVRVVKHRETPGLGDAVSMTHSDWLLGFDGRSLTDPASEQWKVKRDGGIFDQFTGATITPRAVVKAVHEALLYYSKNKEKLFEVNISADTKGTVTAPQKKEP